MNVTCAVPSLSSKLNQSRVWHDGGCVLLRLKIGPRQEGIGRRRRIHSLFFIFSWYWCSKHEDVFAKMNQSLEIEVDNKRKDYKDIIQHDSECLEKKISGGFGRLFCLWSVFLVRCQLSPCRNKFPDPPNCFYTKANLEKSLKHEVSSWKKILEYKAVVVRWEMCFSHPAALCVIQTSSLRTWTHDLHVGTWFMRLRRCSMPFARLPLLFFFQHSENRNYNSRTGGRWRHIWSCV